LENEKVELTRLAVPGYRLVQIRKMEQLTMNRPNSSGNRLRCGAALSMCAMLIAGGPTKGAAPPSDAAAEATEMEKKMLAAINRGDKATCAAMLADDFVSLDHEGRKNKAEILKQLSDEPNKDPAKPHDMRAEALSSDVVLVSYRLWGDEGEEKFGAAMWLSSVWARREGKWANVFSQWSSKPAEPPPPDADPTK
jgi:hypothetical protein